MYEHWTHFIFLKTLFLFLFKISFNMVYQVLEEALKYRTWGEHFRGVLKSPIPQPLDFIWRGYFGNSFLCIKVVISSYFPEIRERRTSSFDIRVWVEIQCYCPSLRWQRVYRGCMDSFNLRTFSNDLNFYFVDGCVIS